MYKVILNDENRPPEKVDADSFTVKPEGIFFVAFDDAQPGDRKGASETVAFFRTAEVTAVISIADE